MAKTIAYSLSGVSSENDRRWPPGQAWLAERTRMVAAQFYGRIAEMQFETKGTAPEAIHKAAIVAQIARTCGALFDPGLPEFSVSWLVDLLVALGDLGDVGHGYYIPRESRTVKFTSLWGRVAGGLPLELSEHREDGILSTIENTIGRLSRLNKSVVEDDPTVEDSEVFHWQSGAYDRIFAELSAELPFRPVSQLPTDRVEFYSAEARRAIVRSERWIAKVPKEPFVVARSGSRPAHYYVLAEKSGRERMGWFEVGKEQARKWVLLAERRAGALNRIRVNRKEDGEEFVLPNMLPSAWTSAVLACASSAVAEEKGWLLEVSSEAREPLYTLLRSANIELI